MTVIRISFDPATITPENECWPTFREGGLVLKVWALYKSQFLTDQYFRNALENLSELIKEAQAPGKAPLYRNVSEFYQVLKRCGFIPEWQALGLHQWLLRNWDYFNPNVQREIRLEYRAAEPETEEGNHMEARLWTVVRFPSGEWSEGGKPSATEYASCEVYQIPADSRANARKKAQNVRAGLIRREAPLPTQSAPYKAAARKAKQS